MRCFVMINGGTGKSVMATAMMPLLKKKIRQRRKSFSVI